MEKRKSFVVPAALFFSILLVCGYAQEHKATGLPAPQETGGMPLMEALAGRQSTREFSPRGLSSQMLSNLLWAAFGVNRTDSGKRTAPSAMNCQEIDIYVATVNGVFLYDAKVNNLKPIIEEDIRVFCSRQSFVKVAPVLLLYVADYSRTRAPAGARDFYSAADTGFISQNVYLFCASEGLATVVMGMVDKDAISKKLGLTENQKIMLAQPVGYRAQ